MPSLSPTFCGVTPEDRDALIRGILRDATLANLVDDPISPQGQAAQWIIDEDEFQVCPDDPKLIQRWALAVMYFSTEGDFWTMCFDGDELCSDGTDDFGNPFISFLSPVDECEWFGITCVAVNGRFCVERIIFEGNNLAGTIPTELGLLEELRVLGMEQGTTSGRIPSELGQLEKMIFIDLDFNELTGEIPSEIYQLTNLQTLDLNVNFLNGTLNTQLGELTNLYWFQLQNNLFSGTIPTEAGQLSLLETFNVHKNDFSGEIPPDMCDLRPIPLSSLIADCQCKGKEGKKNPEKVSCPCCSGCGCKNEKI